MGHPVLMGDSMTSPRAGSFRFPCWVLHLQAVHVFAPGGRMGERKRQHQEPSAYVSLTMSVLWPLLLMGSMETGLYLLQTLWQRQARKKWAGDGGGPAKFCCLLWRPGAFREGWPNTLVMACHLLCPQHLLAEGTLLPIHTHGLGMLFLCRGG